MEIVANIFQRFFGVRNSAINPKIITKEIHKIEKKLIDFDALKIINRLKRFGFDAYIVGGALRDCLLGRVPKDFDVVTNATPKEIKKIFTNGRVIGKRFKLVHIIFANKYIEVATFRANEKYFKKLSNNDQSVDENPSFKRENSFGNMKSDVIRRDFSINALYYDPESETIIDYVGGFKDIKLRYIRPLNPPDKSFTEDPVRMLRAVKYKAILDCDIDNKVLKKIKKYAKELKTASIARLHEEINKILKSGNSKAILLEFYETTILENLIPFLHEDFKTDLKDKIVNYIEKYDTMVSIYGSQDFDLFWGIVLFFRLESEGIDNKDLEYIEKCNNFFMKYLFPLKVPNKVSDILSKSFYLISKLKDKSSISNYRKIINHKYFHEALFLFKIISSDEQLVKFWDSKRGKTNFYTNPKNKRQNKAKKDRNFFKKVITTKNYNTTVNQPD